MHESSVSVLLRMMPALCVRFLESEQRERLISTSRQAPSGQGLSALVSRTLPSWTSVGSHREVLVSEVRHSEQHDVRQATCTGDPNRNTRCYSSDRMMVPGHKLRHDEHGSRVLLEDRHENGNCSESELVATGHCESAMLVLCCSSTPAESCRLADTLWGSWR
jgi:hypothetical protein